MNTDQVSSNNAQIACEIFNGRTSSDSQRLLTLRNVDVFYNKHQALFDISLCIKKGEVLAVTGLNGAGKTTLTRVISGLVHPRSGSIVFKNQNISGMRIEKIKNKGIDLIPDRTAVFSSLSVTDNLKIFFYRSGNKKSVNKSIEESFEIFPRLKERRNFLAGQLSGGEQRM